MAEPQTTAAANWDELWTELGGEGDDPTVELTGLRFRTQEQLIERAFGSLRGLRVIEIGAGRATNALAYALRGAEPTVLDSSRVALEQARRRFASRGLEVTTIESDVFDLPPEIRGSFDVSMSFGLCEHFAGERRRGVIAAHVELLKPGGLAMINVPNRFSPLYRLWMGLAKRRGTWTLGYEVPFSGRELVRLARQSGGVPMPPMYLGGLGTLINHGPNVVLERLGRKPLSVPQTQVPILDYLAYDLLISIVRPGAAPA
jgi:2-polyprenyl-3-methyl-5-hydroxy-6-metoxy-1,4-benzoquinol methylase